MAVDFPNNRPEAGLGSGPLQEGDSWRFNSIEYTWVLSPDGTGMWSSKGINVNPDNYIAKTDSFSGDIEGYYNQPGGFNVTNATNAETAEKVQGTLTLVYKNAEGDEERRVEWNGTDSPTFTFTDTDDATSVINLTGQNGIEVNGNTISANSSIARATNGYATTSAGTPLNASNADNLGNRSAESYALKTDIPNSDAPTLREVLDTDNEATGDNASITLSHAGNSILLNGKDGSIELCRDNSTPFIDFKRNGGSDHDCRIIQSGDNLIIRNRIGGGIYVSDLENGTFRLTPNGGDGNGNGTPTFFGVEQIIGEDGITVSPSEGTGIVTISGSTGIDEPTNNGFYGRSRDGDDIAWVQIPESGTNVFARRTVFWEDYLTPGRTHQQAFEAFARDVNTGNRLNLFVPGGVNIHLTATVDFTDRFGLTGPDTALGRAGAGILFGGPNEDGTGNFNGTIGINATAGMRAVNFKFEGFGENDNDVNVGQSLPDTTPETFIYLGTDLGSDNIDDTDSSFKNCDFGEANSSTILRFNGRNVNVGNCNFSNMRNCDLIRMDWADIFDGGGDEQVESSWRKNRIYNNQFHVSRDRNTCIVIDGDHPLCGLAVTDNVIDTGARFIDVARGGVNGLTVTGNTWYGRFPSNNPPDWVNIMNNGAIQFNGDAEIESATITGNTFGFVQGNVGPNFITVFDGTPVSGLTITGNSFSKCNGSAIRLSNASAANTVIMGNTFSTVSEPFTTLTGGTITPVGGDLNVHS